MIITYRIIYFSRSYTTHDYRFLNALSKTDHQVYFLQLGENDRVYERRPLPSGVRHIDWEGIPEPFNPVNPDRHVNQLKKIIHQIQPDLIHAGPLQRSAYIVALSGFHPLVSMSWGYDLIVDAKRDEAWEQATRHTLGNSSVMIGDCDTIRQMAITYGMEDNRIITFPWGVDLNAFSPGTPKPVDHNKNFKLLSTRGWEYIYGTDLIARAFVKASKTCPNLQLTLLGGGTLERELVSFFKEGGVLDRVVLGGQVEQQVLPDYYQQADLYISASHSDGTSISLLEALACGCPALVSDIPGNLEWIQDGIHGWTFHSGDESALAERILYAVDQRESLLEMGANARKLAEERANWDLNFKHLLTAYQFALENPINRVS